MREGETQRERERRTERGRERKKEREREKDSLLVNYVAQAGRGMPSGFRDTFGGTHGKP